MSAHLISDDTITTPTDPADPAADPTAEPVLDPAAAAGWRTLSAAMTDEVPIIADREDLLVSVAPGAGHGAPACFIPAQATIEVDGTHLGTVDPATATPDSVTDRARYAPTWGLLVHECAHARHSTWEAPPDAPRGAVAAAELLEESRIEAAQIRRRPDDRHWLRASATSLILADTRAADPAHAPTMTPAHAARAAALLLARADGGILTVAETAPVARTVEAVLGSETLAELRAVWQAAHDIDDEDAPAMVDLGRRWCEALGTDPDAPTTPDPATDGEPGSGDLDGSGSRSPLAEAITDALRAVGAAVACEPLPADPGALAALAEQAEQDARDTADEAASAVFDRPTRSAWARTGATALAGTRPPTAEERAAARGIARALSTAGVRDRVATRTTSAMPPGRLKMRGAMAADAQRAAGAIPTAEPFTRTTRRPVPTPPLRLGIACDVSGSMHLFARPVASAAWILAHAANLTPVPATSATVIFGHHVRPITRPGATPTEVTEFEATDGYEAVDTAIDALDGALGLSHPGAARLLVIVSDGDFVVDQRRDGQARVNRLRATGCGVLWLGPAHGYVTPFDGATVYPLTDPTTTAQAIARAATTALRAAQ
jgi:hypothetical protein